MGAPLQSDGNESHLIGCLTEQLFVPRLAKRGLVENEKSARSRKALQPIASQPAIHSAASQPVRELIPTVDSVSVCLLAKLVLGEA